MSRRRDLPGRKARAPAEVPDVIFVLHQGHGDNGQLWETFFDGNAREPDQQVPGVGMSQSREIAEVVRRLCDDGLMAAAGTTPSLVGLARVSTDAWDNAPQIDALTAAGAGRIFTDKVSSRKSVAEREGLSAALGYLREGDTLAVWQLDRLGRSTKEILTIADDLHTRGVGLRILAGTLSGDYQPAGSGKLFSRSWPRSLCSSATRSACGPSPG